MKRLALNLLFLLIIGLLTALGVRQIASAAPEPPRLEDVTLAVLPVRTKVVEMRSPQRQGTAQGRLEGRSTALLMAEEGGRLAWVEPDWRPGQPVQAGQELWRVEDQDLTAMESKLGATRALVEAQVEAADWAEARFGKAAVLEETRLELALSQEKRLEDLVAGGNGSPSVLDQVRTQTLGARRALLEAQEGQVGARIEAKQAQARLLELQAEADLLQLRRSRLTGRAALAGILDSSAPPIGQWTVAGTPFGSIVSDLPPRVMFEVGERDLALLEIGLPVTVFWPGETEAGLDGRLAAIGTRVMASTGELSVEADLLAAPPNWRPGMSVRVHWQGKALGDGIWIEPEFVLWQGGVAGCFVWNETSEGDRARWQPLRLGPERFGLQRAWDGLQAGDRLLVEPLTRLFDGAPISIAVDSSSGQSR